MMKLSWLLLPVLLASCAYISGWNSHKITVNTANGKPAYCLVKNNAGGQWRGYTGKPLWISDEAGGDLRITCAMNGLRGGKIIRVAGGKAYPDYVMINMHAMKKAAAGKDNSQSLPKDNDEEINDFSGDDVQDLRPLNKLPSDPDEDNEVVIIKH